MPKPEHEFFRPDHLPWQPVAGSAVGGAGGPGVREKILSRDADTGDVTRLLQFDAGVETTETITHDFWEEVWILEGELIDLGKQQTFTAGMYACRPPGMIHGPYRVPRGCTTLEMRYGKRPDDRRRHGQAQVRGVDSDVRVERQERRRPQRP
jgi:hypothetical protein